MIPSYVTWTKIDELWWRHHLLTLSTICKNQNIVNVNIYDVLNSIKPKEYKINEILESSKQLKKEEFQLVQVETKSQNKAEQ